MSNNGNRLPIIEALILSSPEPLSTSKIINILQNITKGEINNIVTELNEKYHNSDTSFRIRKIAGGYQVYITENYAGYVEELFTRRRVQKLTRAALETVAIIAYRQPVTRVDIEMIRGVASDSAVRTLLERKFITLSGRAKTIGRPLLYSTTDDFLKYFSLDSLNDLPKMEEIEELLSVKEQESQQILAFEAAENMRDTDIPKDEQEVVEQSKNEDDSELSDLVDNKSVDLDSENIEESNEEKEIEEVINTEMESKIEEPIEPDATEKSDEYDESTEKISTSEYPVNRIEHLKEEIEEETVSDDEAIDSIESEKSEEDDDKEKEAVSIVTSAEDY